ncbi:MAG: TorF family putative porin [Janthinobacterium lividum]
MKNLIYCTSLLMAMASNIARSEDLSPDNPFTFNAAVTSDYRYRGISQTRFQPALQGGADYVNNPTGLYIGTWLSSIKWAKDNGGGGNVEWDIYAGKRGNLGESVTYDAGVLTYVYPGNDLRNLPGFTDANTTELYGQLGYGPAYIKYSHAVTNLFGFVDSTNSGYLDLGANLDAGHGVTINLHAGRQRVQHVSAASYTDWKIGATKDVGFATLAVAYIGTDANKTAYASPANGKFLGRDALLLTISKSF